jgi:hypothetical protein
MVQHLSAVLQHKGVSEMGFKWWGGTEHDSFVYSFLVQWPGLHLIMSLRNSSHPIATPPSQPYWRRSMGFLSDLPLLCVLRRWGDRMRGIKVKIYWERALGASYNIIMNQGVQVSWVVQWSKALYLSARDVTTVPGSNPGCITLGSARLAQCRPGLAGVDRHCK